ncbi:MAG: hypothetical protein M3308_01830 [Actinomycetota bacterium]|nr:hypothetical protein [Actinomycetota bacterium]
MDAGLVSSERVLGWIVLVLAVAQAAGPAVANAVAPNFLETGATNEATITPAGYAFSIWGVICTLSLLSAVALVRHGLGTARERRVLIDLGVVFLGFNVWLWAAAQNWLWITVVVFATMFGLLIDTLRLLTARAHETSCPQWVRLLLTVTVGLYTGWTSVAVFVNVAAALINLGWSPAGSWGTVWQMILLVLATATALALTRLFHATPGYVAAVLWALIAAAISASGRDGTVLAAAAIIATVLVITAALAIRIHHTRAQQSAV